MSKKLCIISGICLLLACFVCIAIMGSTYTAEIQLSQSELTDEDITISFSKDNIVELKAVQVKGNIVCITMHSLNNGKTFLDVLTSGKSIAFGSVYVHRLGIITFDNYFGDCTAGIVVPIAAALYIALILFLLIKEYRCNIGKNLYQYKNILVLGSIIFLSFLLLNLIIHIFNYSGMIHMITSILGSTEMFASILLPIAFVVSIFVTISNINLMRKEGYSWRNMLGCIMGIVFCAATVIPIIIGEVLQRTTIVDVHNEKGIALYIETFIENSIFSVVAYLECILLGTIIIGVKSVRKIPSFDKDYILILGCQIKKDGTLTKLLQSRTDRAIEFAKMQKEANGKEIIFVPSGGKGSDEVIAEAEAIRNYLVETGISEDRILVENKSTSTYENLKNSLEIIREHSDTAEPKLAFSTTNYHVFRAGLLATQQGIKAEGIGSKTKRYFWLNAFIREFIATLYSERKSHRKIVAVLVLVTILMVLTLYLSNNL